MTTVEYRYELWRGEELVATGRLATEDVARVGEPFRIGVWGGTVRDVAPVGSLREFRLIVDLDAHRSA